MNPPSDTRSGESPSEGPASDAQDPGKRPSAGESPLATSLRPRGPAHLELVEREQDGEICLAAQGELDLLTAPKLTSTLGRILHSAQVDVVVDLTDTLFIDSAGLAALLNAQRSLTRRNRKLRVICGAGPVRRVIELARLLDILNVVSE
jgi:anti-sigma B factor antagonist